jgi:hypothetical protein
MTQPKRSILLTAILAAFAMQAQAYDGPTITISGFGTAAMTATDSDQAEYARPNQSNGVKKDFRSGVDSNLGIQANFKFNNEISATVQGLSRKNVTDQFGGELTWAFLKYKINDDFSVRVGRIGMPVYMVSDFRLVGYANTMIRPPAEVYRQVNAENFEGADVVWQKSFDDTTVTAQIGYGNSKNRQPGGVEVTFKPVSTIHIVAENGPFTVRFGRADAEFTVNNSASLTGLIATLNGVGLTQVAKDLKITEVKGSFTSIGGTLDYKNFLVQTEYAKRKTESRLVMDTTSYYAMFGYRMGKVTPYYYYGNIKQDSPRTYAGLPSTGPLAGLTAAINSAVKAGLQSTNAVGVRWDFYKSAALKVQVDRVTPKDGAGGFLAPKPGFTGPVTVYAAGIDFVF